MHPEPADEYFLGDDDGAPREDDGRTRRHALIGLAVVVVLVALAITLTSLLVHTSSSGSGPRTAAQTWVRKVADGDTASRRSLECKNGTQIGDALGRFVTGSHYGLSLGSARQRGTDRWTVPLEVDSPDGVSLISVSLTVLREAGRYVVC